MRFPPFLSLSDKVALISASGPVPEGRLEASIASVRAFGLEPIVYPTCSLKHGYLAGTDKQRAKDLQDAFANPEAKAVICIRGGYGAQRLAEYVDYGKIAESGKGLYGYSDATALHIELNQRGLATWHAPMPSTEWIKELDPFTISSLKAALFGPMPRVLENEDSFPRHTLVPGVAEGILAGGNLSLVASSIGTPYELDASGKILFLEDVDESPYHIDRLLLHLRSRGMFKSCAGVILGPFVDCKASSEKDSLNIDEIIEELLSDIGKPVMKDFQCGHMLPTLSVPLGAKVRLDAGAKSVEILGF
ncbi:MAG: LD-carboxypeptidase [Clostridiales bacterium]|jgi:muramoyltetrapeptide carboxypeptidase|nr:LD-carboxypeptidase [Clostridiales bacterium]